jgi:hypothetical protein
MPLVRIRTNGMLTAVIILLFDFTRMISLFFLLHMSDCSFTLSQ